jgi:L,D-transpeptidase catalytic domain
VSSRRGRLGFGLAALLALAGCGARAEEDGQGAKPEAKPEQDHAGRATAADAGAVTAAGTASAPAQSQAPPPARPIFPPEVRSLRLRRSIAVRLAPAVDSKRLGTVAQDTRVLVRGAAVAPGCEPRWIEIQPRGWVCESHLEPSARPPDGVELPRVARGQLVPGEYGKVASKARILTWTGTKVTGERALAGSAMVRRYGDEVVIRGAPHWRIGPNQFVRSKQIDPYVPSSWHGTRLGDDTGLVLPIGFALADKLPQGAVPIYPAPDANKKAADLPRRTVVQLLETAAGPDDRPAAYRIGDGQWLRAADVRVAARSAPPPTLLADERWIDIDLDRQVLVAYEGELPVYATLVSSGKKKTPTETGIFRVWIKFAETDMSGQMTGEEAYSVSTVPWTQYYAKDLALHTTYWHDRLGQARSHGCVNLAPTDARFLYFWSTPDLPVGWSMAYGVVEQPGSMVRVRSAADPEPAFKGYAQHVAEARRGRAALAPARP